MISLQFRIHPPRSDRLATGRRIAHSGAWSTDPFFLPPSLARRIREQVAPRNQLLESLSLSVSISRISRSVAYPVLHLRIWFLGSVKRSHRSRPSVRILRQTSIDEPTSIKKNKVGDDQIFPRVFLGGAFGCVDRGRRRVTDPHSRRGRSRIFCFLVFPFDRQAHQQKALQLEARHSCVMCDSLISDLQSVDSR